MINVAFAAPHTMTMALFSNGLPRWINSPHGKHTRFIQLAVDAIANHLKVAMVQLSSLQSLHNKQHKLVTKTKI